MGDPAKITLVRPDGRLLEATPEQADRLAILGYRPQTTEEDINRNVAQGRENYYTTGSQQFQAALEGLGSGLTLGGTDYLFGDENTAARAAYNPGTRLGAETVGAVLPMLLTDGASSAATAAEEGGLASRAARFAPSNLISGAAEALAVGKEGSLARAVTKGAIEGGLFGGFQDADHTYLAGDPVTAEAVLHGAGWGALFGGGLGFLGGGAEAAGKKAAAGIESEQSALREAQLAEDSRAATKTVEDNRAFTEDLINRAKNHPTFVPEGSLKAAAGPDFDAFRAGIDDVAREIRTAQSSAQNVVDNTLNQFEKAAGKDIGAISDELARARSSFGKALGASERGSLSEANEYLARYKKAIEDIGGALGMPAGSVPDPGRALSDLMSMKAVAREFRSLPKTVNEFALMGPSKLERLSAALEQAKSLPLTTAGLLSDSTTNLAKALGVDPNSTDLIRSAWKAAKGTFKAEGVPVPEFKPGKPPEITQPKELQSAPKLSPARNPNPEPEGPTLGDHLMGYVFGGKAYVAARAAGYNRGSAYGAYRMVKDTITNAQMLSGVRNAALGRIRQAAAAYLPGAGQGIRAAIPTATMVASSLSTNLYGQHQDPGRLTPQDLAKMRIQEFNQAAPTIKDTLFKAVEPLGVAQPYLTPALHQAALTAFQAVMGMLPKDTGVISGLQSTWKPSLLQAVVLSKQLSVFHDPTKEAADMLKSGNLDPIKMAALKEIAPNTWQDMRLGVLQRITDPAIASKMTYRDQVQLSSMLDIDIHSSTTPQQIASSQAIFAQRAKPLMANPRMGQGGGLPNPTDSANPAKNPEATASQRITEH